MDDFTERVHVSYRDAGRTRCRECNRRPTFMTIGHTTIWKADKHAGRQHVLSGTENPFNNGAQLLIGTILDESGMAVEMSEFQM